MVGDSVDSSSFGPTEIVELAGEPVVVSLESALRERDRRAIYWVALVSLPLFVVGAVAILFVGEWTQLKIALLASMAPGAMVAAWIWLRMRIPGSTVDGLHRWLFAIVAIPVALNLLHYGVFSPAVLVVFLFIYVASGYNRNLGILTYAGSAIFHAVAAWLFLSEKAVDPGLVVLRVAGVEAAAGEAMMQSFLLAGLFIGNSNRRTSIQLLRELHAANLEAARRDVVAQEIVARLKEIQGPERPGQLSGTEMGGYVLGDLLGRGGMGEVYRAQHKTSSDAVAIKVLRPGTTLSPIVLERFRRESEALRKLKHPNIVDFKAAGTWEPSGLPFVAMELLTGQDLSDLLRKKGNLGLSDCLVVISQIASGLDYAKEAGIVHRDLKPQNLFFHENERCWKILDFGIAKSDGAETLTHGYVLGTPAYMSPEHALGKRVDHRSDIFALAAICYRSLTGFPAFSASNVPALLHSVAYDYPSRPSTLTTLHDDVDRVLAVGLSKDPDSRFRSAGEFAAALLMVEKGELSATLRRRGELELAMWETGAVKDSALTADRDSEAREQA